MSCHALQRSRLHKWRVMSHVFICVTWLIHTCDMTHNLGLIHINESCHKYEWFISHIRMRHATFMNESLRVSVCSLFWQRDLCFRKRALYLRKRALHLIYEWVIVSLRLQSVLTKRPMFPQKSPISPQKSPTSHIWMSYRESPSAFVCAVSVSSMFVRERERG